MLDPSPWLKPAQLAEKLGVSTWWVQTEVTAGRIPFHRVGRLTRFSPADVAAIERTTAVPVLDRPRLRGLR
jgi:excisionase family DNA binding protein